MAGILGLAAIAGLVYYLNRRNKKAAAMQQPIGLQDKVPPAPSNNPVVYDSPVNSEPMNYAPVSNAPVNSPSPQNLAPQNLPPVADLGSNGDFYAKQPARLPTPSWGAAPAPANIHEEEAGVFARHGGAAGVNQVDVKTLYKVGGSYMARQPDEISVQAGEEIYIDKAFSDGWVFGVHRSGARGLFPANVLIVPKASGGMAGGAAAPSN